MGLPENIKMYMAAFVPESKCIDRLAKVYFSSPCVKFIYCHLLMLSNELEKKLCLVLYYKCSLLWKMTYSAFLPFLCDSDFHLKIKIEN